MIRPNRSERRRRESERRRNRRKTNRSRPPLEKVKCYYGGQTRTEEGVMVGLPCGNSMLFQKNWTRVSTPTPETSVDVRPTDFLTRPEGNGINGHWVTQKNGEIIDFDFPLMEDINDLPKVYRINPEWVTWSEHQRVTQGYDFSLTMSTYPWLKDLRGHGGCFFNTQIEEFCNGGTRMNVDLGYELSPLLEKLDRTSHPFLLEYIEKHKPILWGSVYFEGDYEDLRKVEFSTPYQWIEDLETQLKQEEVERN